MLNKDNKWVKGTYWALIITFTTLYLAIAFVSTLHAIAFFKIGNSIALAILLAAAYEIGQMSVLFSLLMTHHKKRALAWIMMILLTTLQVTANVYATFKYMDASGSTDWTYWQRSILFWMSGAGTEMYKVSIAWIQGALLPIVALGLTALVVDNIKLMRGDVDLDYYEDDEYEEEYDEPINEDKSDDIVEKIYEISKKITKKDIDESTKVIEDDEFGPVDLTEVEPDKIKLPQIFKEETEEEGFDELKEIEIKEELPKKKPSDLTEVTKMVEEAVEEAKVLSGEAIEKIDNSNEEVKNLDKYESLHELIKEIEETMETEKEPRVSINNITVPVNKVQGWHFKNRYIDNARNVFSRGKYLYTLSKEELDAELAKENVSTNLIVNTAPKVNPNAGKGYVQSKFIDGKEIVDLGMPVKSDRRNWDKPWLNI